MKRLKINDVVVYNTQNGTDIFIGLVTTNYNKEITYIDFGDGYIPVYYVNKVTKIGVL